MPLPGQKPRNRAGRPTKRTEQTVAALMKAIATGAPYVICCRAVGVNFATFMDWKNRDPVFAAKVEQTSAKAALRLLGKIEKQATNNFSACAWILERRFPELFSRPEVQLNLISNSHTENNLTIIIAPEEVREIESRAEPVRRKVKAMLQAYRPEAFTEGNGQSKVHQNESLDIPAKVVSSPIVRKEGAETSPLFWNLFASGEGDRTVEKATAIYVAKTVVDEVLGGGRGNQAIVSFRTEPVTVADVLSVIERLCGGSPAGWQRVQRKAGIKL